MGLLVHLQRIPKGGTMKRSLTLALLGVCVLGGVAHAALPPPEVSVGVFGGLSVPVLQDVDASSFSPSDAFGDTGSQFGVRVPVVVIPVVTSSPTSPSRATGTEETFRITYTREGFDGTAFGVNAISAASGGGLKFYPYVGIASNKLERTGQEIKEVGYNFGLGLGIPAAAKITVQIRGEFSMVATGDTSRKFTNATVGLNYSLLP
jgi:hypothetical protein